MLPVDHPDVALASSSCRLLSLLKSLTLRSFEVLRPQGGYIRGRQSEFDMLELGHLTTSDKTTPFAQFSPVSHEVKFETEVKTDY
jgi:hypothetical protein